jgi:hypothetical protein
MHGLNKTGPGSRRAVTGKPGDHLRRSFTTLLSGKSRVPHPARRLIGAANASSIGAVLALVALGAPYLLPPLTFSLDRLISLFVVSVTTASP